MEIASTSLWKQPNFIKLWLSQVFNLLAQILLEVVLISQVYYMTNSVLGASLVPALTSISVFLGSLFASYHINKFHLQKLLYSIGWIRAFIMILFIFISLLSISNSVYIFLILLLKFILSFMGSWYGPARFAILPLVVSRQQYIKANGTITMIQQLIMTAGWGLGSASLLLLSTTQLMLCSCIMFVASGMLIHWLKFHKQDQQAPKIKKKAKPSWKIALQSPIIRSITLMDMVEGLANAIWSSALLLGFTTIVLQETEAWWGFINSGYFIGAILGSFVVVIYSKIVQNKITTMIAISAVAMGVLTFLFSISTSPLIAVILCVLMGPMYQIRDIAQSTILQDVIPENQRASVMAARNMVLSPWNGLAIIIMGLCSEWIGIQYVFMVAAGLYLMTAGIAIVQPQLKNYRYSSEDNSTVSE
ncbi:MFS transporter [Longirhabdus pacifica]|uniref:MFS transporter n=1 Tax=Longirhabdus pacifica TaxID=2305227 RepID=UPI0013E8AAD3|nr:MFS transporter [Longirhabdus pacifica]